MLVDKLIFALQSISSIMNQFIFLMLSIVLVNEVCGQHLQPFQHFQSKKWGFKTTKSVAIEPIYEAVLPFYEDYACVKTVKGWGIIFQTQKKYIVEPQFLAIQVLDDHSLWVQNSANLWGIMNYNGTWIQSCQYQSLAFWESCLLPQNMVPNKPLADWDTVLFQQNNVFGFMTRQGVVLKNLPYNHIGSFEDNPHFAVVCMLDEEGVGVKWGMIDKYGVEIIPCIYDDLGNRWGHFGYDLKSRRLNSRDIFVIVGDSCGYYNFKGEMIVPLDVCK